MLRVAALLSLILVQTVFCAVPPKERRHLLDWSDKINAAASITHGGLDHDNIHKLIWGWNQDYNTRRRLLDTPDVSSIIQGKVNAAASIAHGGLDKENIHKLIWGWNQDYNTRRRLRDTPDMDVSSLFPKIEGKLNAAASIAHGGLDGDNIHKLVWGWNQDYNTRRRLLDDKPETIKVKANAAVSIAHGGLDDDNLHKLVWGWQQMRAGRRHLQEVAKERAAKHALPLQK